MSDRGHVIIGVDIFRRDGNLGEETSGGVERESEHNGEETRNTRVTGRGRVR